MRSLLAAALLALPLLGQQATELDPVVKEIIAQGRDHSRVMEFLDELVNGIGPRLTGSDRLNQAVDWAVAHFSRMGLDARKEQWGEVALGFNRGPASGRMIQPREMSFTFGTAAWSRGTKGRQKGEAVLAPRTMEELNDAEGTLAGKWVLEPPRRRGGRLRPRRDRGNPEAARIKSLPGEVRKALPELYAKEGILGVIRSTGGSLVRTSGRLNTTRKTIPELLTINMIEEDWLAIRKEIRAGKQPELEFDIRNFFRDGPVPVYNVIADIKGTEWPDEYVIIGGHCDSWDGATGTTDNGTGVSTTLEAARILSSIQARPKRTIRFMLWSGEEQGLLGSRAWVKKHADVTKKISAVFVHDGGTNYAGGLGCTKSQLEDFERIFAPAMTLAPEEMPFKLRVVDSIGGSGGGSSDHASFIRAGVPGYFWDQRGRAVYGYGWHTQNDTYDLAIPAYQKHTATVAALAAWGVANLDHLLSRKEMGSRGGSRRRRLGVQLSVGSLKIESVSDETAASRADLKAGDVILAIDDQSVKDRLELRRMLNRRAAPKTITVKRGGEKLVRKLSYPARGRSR